VADRVNLGNVRRAIRLTLLAGIAGGLVGCTSLDSYLDPSVIGRYEYNPTSVAVLNYISSIEDKPRDLVEYSAVTSEDLLPSPADYRFGPGDRLEIRIKDIVQKDAVEVYNRLVDIRGLVDIPQLGRIYVNGRNIPQVRKQISDLAAKFIADPIVEIDILESRQQTYSIVGGADRPGTYIVPKPDYRILEALTNAGRIDFPAKYVDVIRVVAIDAALDEPTGTPPPDAVGTETGGLNGTVTPSVDPNKAGQDLLDAIDSISGEGAKKDEEKPKQPPSPGALLGNQGRELVDRQPGETRRAVIDLDDPGARPSASSATRTAGNSEAGAVRGGSPWVFVNGKWAQAKTQVAGGSDAMLLPSEGRRASEIVTQRVIRIPRDRLEAGDSTINIIVRPGDVIRIPEAQQGVFYLGGQVRRPGSFNLPVDGRMTIKRAIDTAGGLDSLAWPERGELTRSLGDGRQAIVSFNLRAIYEGTQPDVYLKPDDQVTIGTSFWATPLAVLRSGFRASYGFGFLLDRNFGSDVFGLPPEYKTRPRSPFGF
jgi:polysaccharide export outer membrane protein